MGTLKTCRHIRHALRGSSTRRAISKGLAKLYPDAHCALHFENPLQLLIATILSAQCTDVRVNLVTPALFKRYPDARAFADAELADLERMIQSSGFLSQQGEEHQGVLPTPR